MPEIATKLIRLADEVRSGRATESAESIGKRMAGVLQWETRNAHTEQLQLDLPFAGMTEVTRGFVADQPAAIFVDRRCARHDNLLSSAALFAYHASIEWGMLVDPAEIILFNSHWIRNSDWFSLPPIAWAELADKAKILEGMTPSALTRGEMERIASRFYEPDRMVLPVDDALVERLDFWRGEALRSTRRRDGVDESLQRLFSQLFVLRAIEDRGLERTVPSLTTTRGEFGEADIAKLTAVFAKAAETIQSDLFDTTDLEGLDPSVLGGIIQDLYVPAHLPARGAKYNFAWMGADVLGHAYEKYLSTLLIPTTATQLRLFGASTTEVERMPAARKVSGSYYTPSFLARYLTDRCLAHYFEVGDSQSTELPKVVDMSCGSGSFLTATADSLIRRLRERDPERNWGRELIKNGCITGIDNDSRAVTFARLSLWLRLAQEPDPLPLPRLEQAIVHGDSLTSTTWAGLPKQYDIVLGNPPFIPSGSVQSRQELCKRFKTAQGRFDYSYLFVELAVDKLRAGGLLGLVIPNRTFRNRDAAPIRDILSAEMDILSIVDFGSSEVFAGTASYIATIIAQKGRADPAPEGVRFIRVLGLPSRFAGVMLSDADRRSAFISSKYLTAYTTPHPRDSQPWLLLSPKARHARVQLEGRSEPLDSLGARIVQGIKTGANDLFLCELLSDTSGALAQVRNGFGDVDLIESRILKPAILGPDIQRYEIAEAKRMLIYPYVHGKALTEQELLVDYPNTFAYLSTYRALLGSRTSALASGLHWYELVRKRDETWLDSPKLLIRDLATEPAFALDQTGGIYLIGGVAIIPADSAQLLPLLAYLNSSLTKALLRQVAQEFRAGFRKFEPQHLGRLPVITDILDDEGLRDELAGYACRILEATAVDDIASQRLYETKVDRLLSKLAGFALSEM